MRRRSRSSRVAVAAAARASLVLAAIGGGALAAQPLPGRSTAPPPRDGAARVTFTRDIAPIIEARCAACHRPEGGAPFSLLEYRDVRPRATLVASVTRSRYMPPWKPRPGHGTFADERRLSDAEIALIEAWVRQGAREGEPDAPRPPREHPEWAFGTPDLVLTMPEPFTLAAEGADTIRSFVLPVPGDRERVVAAVEFDPGNARVVHHANIKIDTTGSSRRLDAEDAEPGFDGSSRDARFPDGYFLGWTPGQRAYAVPGSAWSLPAGADVVVELHLTPSGKAEPVRARIGVFLTDTAPARAPYMIRLGSQRIDIPAGASAYVSRDRYVLPVDVDVLAVQPHAHNLARSIQASATLPGGRREWLIDIGDWDFRWQDVYRFASPVRLPRGTVLEMAYAYDNSTANPRNPHQPPRRVTFGQTSTSEMGDVWLQVATASDADRAALAADYAPKMLAEDIAGDETTLLTRPSDARLRMDLASSYAAAGRTDDAVAEYGRALALDPDSAAAHYELGLILLKAKRFDQAAAHFRRVVALTPGAYDGYNNLGAIALARGDTADAIALLEKSNRLRENAEAHYNLGRAHARARHADEAETHYRAALRLAPGDPDTRAALGAVLAERGDVRAAVVQYREALRLRPAHVGALADLAWLLATSDDAAVREPSEAVRLADQAVHLTASRNAVVLETLAVAYAAAGRHGDAVRTLGAAASLADADHDAVTADRLRLRARQLDAGVPP